MGFVRPSITGLFIFAAYEVKDDVLSLWHMGDMQFALCVLGAFVLTVVGWFLVKETF